MIFFFIKFILTNIIFSTIIGLVAVRFNPGKSTEKIRNRELLLYCLGLGPVFTALILYFLLLLLPGHGDFLYLSIILAFYAGLAIVGRKSIAILIKALKKAATNFQGKFKKLTTPRKIETLTHITLVTILLVGFLGLHFTGTLQTPLEGHDVLVYANLGEMYYDGKIITYKDYMVNNRNGFFFSGSPKPSFSLLLTWEMILNNCFGFSDITHQNENEPKGTVKKSSDTPKWKSKKDLYFRSITVYYGLLILAVSFMWLYRKNKYLALLGILTLLGGIRFFIMMLNFHLDSYRIFFLMVSWIFLGYSIERKNRFFFLVFGIFTGLTAFTHLIGVVMALINCTAYFLFHENPFKKRLLNSLYLGLVVLGFGGIHYLLEAILGAHWGFMTYFH